MFCKIKIDRSLPSFEYGIGALGSTRTIPLPPWGDIDGVPSMGVNLAVKVRCGLGSGHYKLMARVSAMRLNLKED